MLCQLGEVKQQLKKEMRLKEKAEGGLMVAEAKNAKLLKAYSWDAQADLRRAKEETARVRLEVNELVHKLKALTEADMGVTEPFSPPHFCKITPRCCLTCCRAAYRCDLMTTQQVAAIFLLYAPLRFVLAGLAPSLRPALPGPPAPKIRVLDRVQNW